MCSGGPRLLRRPIADGVLDKTSLAASPALSAALLYFLPLAALWLTSRFTVGLLTLVLQSITKTLLLIFLSAVRQKLGGFLLKKKKKMCQMF